MKKIIYTSLLLCLSIYGCYDEKKAAGPKYLMLIDSILKDENLTHAKYNVRYHPREYARDASLDSKVYMQFDIDSVKADTRETSKIKTGDAIRPVE